MFYFFIGLRRFYLPRGNQRTIGPENAHLKPDLVTINTTESCWSENWQAIGFASVENDNVLDVQAIFHLL